ncbi:unnamed protein product [Thlaspi arvense]|uniref:WIYLD domain-containing protein n=1 Tax=Thlaspi arvense TaxID=13288 RepID=A0AAU9RSN5_THLAR|nr:unnamed protein product [Thlaspi arvense]
MFFYVSFKTIFTCLSSIPRAFIALKAFLNWELIAKDNYKALADAIFEAQETQTTQERNEMEKKAECSGSEPDRGKKKAREIGWDSVMSIASKI